MCGTESADDVGFCTKCGYAFAPATPAAPERKPAASIPYDMSRVWPEWTLEQQLGRGSYGVVYRAVRRDSKVESYSAIKIIKIPTDPSEIDSLRSEGLDEEGTRSYFQGIVDGFVSEIQLMESLKGIQNIVSVEDYRVLSDADDIGFEIYIRMELLTPFNVHIRDNPLGEEEVISLGRDICSALEICARSGIIHRDIKPENIFVNSFGHYKLGDFGIARKLENATGGMSQKGTFNYMAPEVATGTDYDARVDIYSLGIVLYRMLNSNRLPFLDSEKQVLDPNERKNAVDRRIRGEALPPPCNASPAMADVILRACAHDPGRRFASAKEMKKALNAVAAGTYVPVMNTTPAPQDYDATVSVRRAAPASAPAQAQAPRFAPQSAPQYAPVQTAPAPAWQTPPVTPPNMPASAYQAPPVSGYAPTAEPKKKKNGKAVGIIVAILVIVGLVVGGILLFGDDDGGTSSSSSSSSSSSKNKSDKNSGTSTGDGGSSGNTPTVAFTKGTTVNGVYTNTWANLKYTIPAGYDDDTDIANKSVDGVNKVYGVCIWGDDDTDGFIDFEKKSNASDAPKTAREYVEYYVEYFKSDTDMTTTASEITQTNIGGIIYQTVSIVTQDSYETLYINIAISEKDGYFIRLGFGSESRERVNELTAGISALS